MNIFLVSCFSVFLVISALADDAALIQRKNAAAEDCKKELNAGEDVIAILATKQSPNTEAQSCFLECIYEKLGLIKGGSLNEEGTKALAKAKFGDDKEKLAKTDEIFKKCQQDAQAASNEKCSIGKSLRKCLLTYDEQIPLFPKSS